MLDHYVACLDLKGLRCLVVGARRDGATRRSRACARASADRASSPEEYEP